jgi:DNA-directed RNA polymerase specialized sigma24 family protein
MDENFAVDRHDLQRAIDQLPLRQKAVLALRYAGYKQKDIRILLGISRNTVWADEKAAYTSLRFLLASAIEGSV